ncbi:DUF4191 domain-containing protein [Dermabacteraceae bacterium P13115]|nr:DUF4191 domain-containing protein [Dermabacteraceae bacterium TAE3-ERU5]
MAATNKTETAPKKKGRIKQFFEVVQFTQKADNTTVPWMIGAFVGVVLLFTLLFGYFGHPYYGLFVGIAFGLLAAAYVIAQKAQTAAYTQIKGQPGAALAAMQSIRRGWNVEQEPCALDARSRNMVFRASGRAGIALVTEGTNGKAHKLLEKEESRLSKLFPNVPLHAITVGDGEGQVPLEKLAGKMQRMRPKLTREESAEVARRLQAMPGPLQQAMPKGVDPLRMRPNRKAMRGR